MRHRGSRRNEEAPSYDSFLDIVANLVGIMIILVMVVGVRAKDALVEAAVSSESTTNATDDSAGSKLAVEQLQTNINEIQNKIEDVNDETIIQYNYRGKLQTLVTAVEPEIDKRRHELDESARRRFDMEVNLSAAHRELDDLTQARAHLEKKTQQPIVVEHLPTPLAKTVFGKEVHFRLVGGRLAYVPMDELIGKLKGQWQQKVWKLKESPEITETIGPVRGFRMQYTVGRINFAVDSRIGTTHRQVVTVKGFEMIPVQENLGQPLSLALEESSEFFGILSNYDPQQTTVTVWTYPDSFDDFRVLKYKLLERGYLTAGRPLPTGHPISGSPTGSRSAAQ